MSRDLKPGEVPTPDTTTTAVDLVRVQHTVTGQTAVVRRRQMAQMDPRWEPQDPTDLKGQALDQALEDAGLPKTGSADEKRARLAEHEDATTLAAASDSTVDAAVITTENNEE